MHTYTHTYECMHGCVFLHFFVISIFQFVATCKCAVVFCCVPSACLFPAFLCHFRGVLFFIWMCVGWRTSPRRRYLCQLSAYNSSWLVHCIVPFIFCSLQWCVIQRDLQHSNNTSVAVDCFPPPWQNTQTKQLGLVQGYAEIECQNFTRDTKCCNYCDFHSDCSDDDTLDDAAGIVFLFLFHSLRVSLS